MCLISVKWNIYLWILSKKVVNFEIIKERIKLRRKQAKEMINELENKGVAENDNQQNYTNKVKKRSLTGLGRCGKRGYLASRDLTTEKKKLIKSREHRQAFYKPLMPQNVYQVS